MIEDFKNMGFSKVYRDRESENYIFLSESNNRVVKYSRSPSNLVKEKQILSEFDSCDFLPKLLQSEFNKEGGYIMMEYYEDQRIDLDNINNTIRDLGRKLSEVHSLDYSNINWSIGERETFTDYNKQIKYIHELNLESIQNTSYEKYKDKLEDIYEKLLDMKTEIVLSHNDVHLSNVLIDNNNEINKIVDWELATPNDYHIDICTAEIGIIDFYSNISKKEEKDLRKEFRDSYNKEINTCKLKLLKKSYLLAIVGNLESGMEIPHWSRHTKEEVKNIYKDMVRKSFSCF